MKRLLLFGFLFLLITSVIISCQKELSFESDQNLGHGTLYDTNKSCQPIVPSGTYYNGVSAVRDTNYVTVIVTVTQTGSYTLMTDSTNGFGFRHSGYFTSLGTDTIQLEAFGSPILNVPTDFTISLDSSTCGFTINVQDSTGTGLGGGGGVGVITGDSSFVDPVAATAGTWHFTDSTYGKTYSGIFNTSNTTTPEGGFFQNDTLYVIGEAGTSDSLFAITLAMPSIVPGIYPINGDNIVLFGINSTQTPLFGADASTALAATSNGNSYVTITSYSNNQLAGSFHVYADDANGVLTLIAGSFSCTVQ